MKSKLSKKLLRLKLIEAGADGALVNDVVQEMVDFGFWSDPEISEHLRAIKIFEDV